MLKGDFSSKGKRSKPYHRGHYLGDTPVGLSRCRPNVESVHYTISILRSAVNS